MKHPILTRILALSLSALTLLSSVACATVDDPQDTNAATEDTQASANGTTPEVTEEESETRYTPDIEKKNYNCDFNITIGGTFGEDYILVDEEDVTDDALDNAVYERSIHILDQLGVTCVLQDTGGWLEYSGKVIRSVQAGDDDYQLVLTPVYQGVCDLITSNALYDFAELPAVNLNAPYWATDLMEDIQINGKYLLGYNDMCLSLVYAVVFNKDLQEDFQVELPYDTVRSMNWTFDKMNQMASVVAVNNGDGDWTAEDTYGITGWGWVPLISLFTASDIRIVDRDANDDYVIAYDMQKEKSISLIDKVFAMYEAEYTWFWKSYPADGTVVSFADGTSLFQFISTSELTSFRDKELRFGILPYPMYDENQDNYRTLSWNGMMAVPSVIKNPEMVGEVLELLAYHTEPVKYAYYENLLASKLADAPDDVEMLNIIWDTQITDVGIITCNASQVMDEMVYMLPKMLEAGSNTYTSFMKKSARAQDALDKVFKQGKFAE